MATNPYSPPTATDAQPQAAGLSGPYGAFRNNGTLKTALVSLLIIDAMLTIFNSGILNLMDIKQQGGNYWENEEPSQLDTIITVAGGLHTFLIIATIITFAIWINRSCKNAWLLDPPRIKTTPGWAVGFYFIPVLNLWKPYVAMKEIRSASFGRDDQLRSLLPLWWTFWLISSLLGNIITQMYLKVDDPEAYLMANKLDLVTVPVDVILNYLAIALVTSITLAQQRRAAQWRP